MSLRAFTVFQDTPSDEAPRVKVMRPNAMATRSQTRSNIASSNTELTTSTPDLDKENYDPVTGERAGPGGSIAGKKRKTAVLATKAQRPTKGSQPEKKKRKPSPPSSNSAETKLVKKPLKATRKGKRTGSRKVSPMPKVPEEDEVGKIIAPVTQREIDSRCKELTIRPLADVSEAYDELSLLGPSPSGVGDESEAKTGQCTVKVRSVCFRKVYLHVKSCISYLKAQSVEPEIRDYFEPSETHFTSSTATRLRALSEDASEARTFSTPERKKIYAAFTFSSPVGPSKSSHDDDIGSYTPDLA
jgi:hypothetical protein